MSYVSSSIIHLNKKNDRNHNSKKYNEAQEDDDRESSILEFRKMKSESFPPLALLLKQPNLENPAYSHWISIEFKALFKIMCLIIHIIEMLTFLIGHVTVG